MRPELSKLKITVFLVFLSCLIVSASGQGALEPNPQIQNISIYNVTDSTGEGRYTGGNYITSGLNTTFLINQTKDNRDYRFTFRLNNTGDGDWALEGADDLLHDGLDTGWSINRTWYNISGTEYVGGTFSGGTLEWNTSQGGTLSTGENLYAKYIVEINLPESQTYDQRFLANDTSENNATEDEHVLDLNRLGSLSVVIEEPPNETVVAQNKTFQLNATIDCAGGECGNVSANARYNQSSTADTLIPENSGTPFHTTNSNLRDCGELLASENCTVVWDVNATGEKNSWHLLDSNITSTYDKIEGQESADTEVQIKQVVMLNLSWSTTDFGVLDPGDQNKSAIGNDNLTYNVTVQEKSNDADIWLKGKDIQSQDSDYFIGIGNMTYSLDNSYDTSTPVQDAYELVKSSVAGDTVLNTFYWLDVPTGIYKGDYNGTITYKANLSG